MKDRITQWMAVRLLGCFALTPGRSRAEVDLNCDGYADLLWQNQSTGYGTVSSGSPPEWKVVATCDLNGDGKPDILWQNVNTGDVSYWLLNGVTYTGVGSIATGVPTLWRIVGVADLNRDGYCDLIW